LALRLLLILAVEEIVVVLSRPSKVRRARTDRGTAADRQIGR
jgi:hypothetical protein